jgi:hypothetical protein
VSRRSYRYLASLPAFGLFAADGKLVATVRAEDAPAARDVFKAHGYSGDGMRVRRLPEDRPTVVAPDVADD